MTEITVENLLAAGYREYPVNKALDRHSRAFQKRFDAKEEDPKGKRFYLNFRLWEPLGILSLQFDAFLWCGTDTNGDVWITIRENNSIEATEERAEALWKAAGSSYYELYEEEEAA